MRRLTSVELAALKVSERMQRVTVDKGLLLRISPNGERCWLVRYSVDGTRKEYRLPKIFGRVSDDAHLSLADARAEAGRILALARAGTDVQVEMAERVAREAALRDAQRVGDATFGDMFDSWVINGVNRKDGNEDIRRRFAADVLPFVGSVRVAETTDQQLCGVIRAVANRGAPRAAVMLRNDLAQMFGWAGKRQPWRRLLVEGNPMDLVEIDKLVPPDYDLDNERHRYLSLDELCELKAKLDGMRAEYGNAPDRRRARQPLERTTELAVWIMLGTLCRVGELSLARWDDIDFEKNEWRIPKKNIKRGRQDFIVFLSPFARDRFIELHNETGDSDWCLPGADRLDSIGTKAITRQLGDRQTMFKTSRGGGPRQPLPKRANDNQLVLAGGKNGEWTSHDLRRTGATMMQQLGIGLDVIDRCQNHVVHTRKVRNHYLLYEYAAEKRQAWTALSNKLEQILRF
jgi:integrase